MAKARWNNPKLSEFIASLDGFTNPQEIKELCGAGLYETARVVADQVKVNLNNLLTRTTDYLDLDQAERRYLPSEAQKKGLIASFGISAMRTSGHLNYDVKLGFDGYNDVVTNTYPQGQPNALIGRLIESGGTFMDKQPFFRPALNASKSKAKEEGKKAIMELLEKHFE